MAYGMAAALRSNIKVNVADGINLANEFILAGILKSCRTNVGPT